MPPAAVLVGGEVPSTLLAVSRRPEVGLTIAPPGFLGLSVDLSGMGYTAVRTATPSSKRTSAALPAAAGTSDPSFGDIDAERDARQRSSAGRGIARAGLPRPLDLGPGASILSFETGGDVVTSQESPAFTSLGAKGREFRFQIRFETDEVPAPGSFFDSITVSLRGGGGSLSVATLVTVDAFGITPAPSAPGGLFLDAASVSYMAVPETSGAVLAHVQTYDVTVVLPGGLAGDPVTLIATSDFFDNQNGIASKATVVLPTAVPEPGPVALLLTGLAALVWIRRSTP